MKRARSSEVYVWKGFGRRAPGLTALPLGQGFVLHRRRARRAAAKTAGRHRKGA